jgi:hypothetical protein
MMKRVSRSLRVPVRVAFTCSVLAAPTSGQPTGRPFSIDDVLKMQEIGAITRSPDGELLAVVVVRAAGPGEAYLRQMRGNDRSDLWLVSTKDGTVTKLTAGGKDQTGFWSPSWSPDGKKLAYYTVTGAGPVQLGVWDRATGKLKRVSDKSIDPYAQVSGTGFGSIAWLSEKTVLVSMYPPGGSGNERGQLSITDNVMEAWKKADKGIEPSVSVVTSGNVKGSPPRSPRMIGSLDISTGQFTPIVDGAIRGMAMSPKRTHLAIAVDSGMRQPRAGRPFGFPDSRHWKLGLVTLAKPNQVRWVGGVFTAGQPLVTWSPDGSQFSLVGDVRDEGTGGVALVAAVDADSAKPALPGGWNARAVAWTDRNELLTLATQPAATPTPPADAKGAKPPRADWYVASASSPRNLTAAMKSAPSALKRAPGSKMIGIADDTLWSIDVSAATATALTRSVAKVTSIVWPGDAAVDGSVIVQAGEKTAPALHRVDLATATTTPVPMPNVIAALKDFDARSGMTVFTGNLPVGTYLWLGGAGADFRKPIALNEFIAEVVSGKRMMIDYTGVEGDTLKALVVLPYGYQEGKKYPAVAWVYAGCLRSY